MEIEAAELAGDVDDFPDEKQAGDQARFHGFTGQFAGVDAAGGDFGFGIAFGVHGKDSPVMQLLFEGGEGGIGVIGQGVELQPAVGEPIGQKLLKAFAHGGQVAARGGAEGSGGVESGSEVEMDGLTGPPVGGDLQNGRAAESAMSEEHFFAKGMIVGGGDHFGGDAGQFGIAAMALAVEDEGNKGRACGNDVVAKLASEVVTEGSGADFRNGEAAGSDDQDGGAKFGGVRAQDEFGGALDFGDAGVEEDLDFGGAAFGFEERSDVGGGTITEKLAECFFMVRDVVLFDECQEIGRSVTGQRGFGEMWIGGMKVFGGGVDIGEVAAASTGDEDFFADPVGVLDERDAAAAFGGFECAEKSGGASAED